MAVSDLDMRAARIAVTEWWHWGSVYVSSESSGATKKTAGGDNELPTKSDSPEDEFGYRQRVLTYFKMGVYPDNTRWKNNVDDPWSAAFISYCFRMAGAGQSFPYHVGHWRYVTEAVRNRNSGNSSDAIVAYRNTDIPPAVGDLVWRGRKVWDKSAGVWRDGTSKWTLDDIQAHIDGGGTSFASHCDLVVDIDQDTQRCYVIGGNVSNRVLRLQSKIDENGMLSKSSRYKVIVRNNIGEVIGY